MTKQTMTLTAEIDGNVVFSALIINIDPAEYDESDKLGTCILKLSDELGEHPRKACIVAMTDSFSGECMKFEGLFEGRDVNGLARISLLSKAVVSLARAGK